MRNLYSGTKGQPKLRDLFVSKYVLGQPANARLRAREGFSLSAVNAGPIGYDLLGDAQELFALVAAFE